MAYLESGTGMYHKTKKPKRRGKKKLGSNVYVEIMYESEISL